MLSHEDVLSSSSGILDCSENCYSRVVDVLEGRLARTLSLLLRETVEVAFAAETVKWSAHLQSALWHMENELITRLNIRSPPPAWLTQTISRDEVPVATTSGNHDTNQRYAIERDTPLEGPETLPALPSMIDIDSDVGDTTCGSAPIILGVQSPRSTRSLRSPLPVRDIDSLEQRLANNAFTTRLGHFREVSEGSSASSSLDGQSESVLPVTIEHSDSFSSLTPGPSAAVTAFKRIESVGSTPNYTSMSNLREKQWRQATKKLDGCEMITSAERKLTGTSLLLRLFPRLFGVLPWNPKYRCMSMLYQASVLLASVLAALSIIMVFRDRARVGEGVSLFACLDIMLAFGVFLGLCSCLFYNGAIVTATKLLESYASRADIGERWDTRSCKDVCCVMVVCASSVCLDIAGYGGMGRATEIAFLKLLLLAMCSHILRLCRCLCFLIDVYCSYMEDNDDFADAVQEWHLLHATCRRVCASFQLCFAILQSVAIGALVFSVAAVDIRLIWGSPVFLQLHSGVFSVIVIANLSICASTFTQKCSRVPMMVNALASDALDPRRHYLVEYIAKTNAGFYIFDVRLSSGILLKIFYVACAGAFSFASQTLKTWN